ncbi:MAG: prolyl oligopeptidase family serine peptidase [Gammaproteobacteria bacterium]
MHLTTILVAAATAAGVAAIDPFLWLEDVEGERAIEWVRAQNERSLAELTKDARYERFYTKALAIAEDKSRIPNGTLRAGWIYNFWQDDEHVRGIWRRTPVASYRKPSPEWQVLLDVDALAKVEEKNWVFKSVTCLPPAGTRCMVQLSSGGKDAIVQREFDVKTRSFVGDGFVMPEAKSEVAWKNADTLIVATDWGADTLTTSGYPYIVKEWRRGQPLADAKELYRGQLTDVGVYPVTYESESGARLIAIYEADTFFTATIWSLDSAGLPVRVTLPPRVTPRGYHRGELVFTIEEDWRIGDRAFRSGSLLSMPVAELGAAAPAVRLILEPGPRDSIEDVEVTGAGVLAATYSNVRGGVLRFSLAHGRWKSERLPLPDTGAVTLENADPTAATAYVTYEDFLQPDTLFEVDVPANRAAAIKKLPAKFDGSRYGTEQFEAVSRDGTRVPYFVVRSKTFKADGTAPTLLYAYGGFQISMTPSYSAAIGQLWLEEGGVFVLANIRGGGEFGPAWHQAGLKTKRQVVYDDFIAVAEDLIRRKITSPRRLGIQGGSNGGLLMGAALTQRPELFHAAVVQVPLLDMLRYHTMLAGASWVDEYGSPDVPEERAWLEQLSPYHRLAKRDDFPVPFFVTSSKDDRVHPAHARKFAARMASLGMPYYYYENIDGGHSAAANQREKAKRQALEFTYLARRLID